LTTKCKRPTINQDPTQHRQRHLSEPGRDTSFASPGVPTTSGPSKGRGLGRVMRQWACIHAKAVNNETRADRTSSSQAVADTVDTMRLGAEGILEDAEEEGGRDAAPPEAATAAAAAATLEASMRPRRARNMFPSAKEVEMCDRYAAFVEGEREAPGEFQFTDFLHVEDECFQCDERWTESTASKPTLATLFTIRGRLAIVTKSWTCARGHNVAYDGSVDGLFAFRPETVYTRVFLDSIIELCVIARSTLAAASEFLNSFLRNTVAFAEVEPGQARQQLSDACGEFSDTLVVPKVAFVCHRCGEDEAVGGSFHCVVCDGQILSVLQAHVVAMLRHGMHAPRADFAMNFACAVRYSSPRRVIRNRVRATPTDVSALTRAEAEMWPLFAAVANGLPPAPPSLPRRGPPRTDTEKEAAALWAAITLVNTFFTVEEAQPARVAAAAAGIAGGEDGERLDDEEEDVVNLLRRVTRKMARVTAGGCTGSGALLALGRIWTEVATTLTVAAVLMSTTGCTRGRSGQLPPLLSCHMRRGRRKSSCLRLCSASLSDKKAQAVRLV